MFGRLNAEDLLDAYFVNEFQRRALCSAKALGCLQALLLKALREDPEFAAEVAACLPGPVSAQQAGASVTSGATSDHSSGSERASGSVQKRQNTEDRGHNGGSDSPGYPSSNSYRANSYQPSWQDSGNNRARQVEPENERLRAQLREQEQENKRLRTQLHELEQSNQEMKRSSQAIAQRYAALEGVYQSFHRLPENTRERLLPLFGAGNICAMIYSLGGWNNVSQLWEFAKRRLVEGESAQATEVGQLFVSAFAIFQEIRGAEDYELLQPRVGESYDYRYHSIMGNRTDGTVSKVLLPGIMIQGQIKQKALVEVR